MKKGCLPGFSFVGRPRDKERILVTTQDKRFPPGNRPRHSSTLLDLSHALGGGRDEVGLGSSFHFLAAATATKFGPRR